MPKTLNEIQRLLENPTNQSQIQTAVAHEDRVRLHVESKITQGTSGAVTEYLRWVDSMLPEYKAAMFRRLVRFPLKSVSLSDEIFDALEKVFDGRDRDREFIFSSVDLERDRKEFFDNSGFEGKWRRESFLAYRHRFNSIMVVDLPREQEGDMPEPYFYFLPVEQVIAFDGDGRNIDWIFFKITDERWAYYDAAAYQVITIKDGVPVGIESTNEHDLGYCPAAFFIDEPISMTEPYQKKSVVSGQLASFDWYLFHAVSKMHLDLYAGYPIYWGYAPDCDYEDLMQDLICRDGFLVNSNGQHSIDRASGSLNICPVCSQSRLNGPGSYNQVPRPIDKEDADLGQPVGVVPTDTQSLIYNREEHSRLHLEIYTNITGFGGDLKTEQAVNEKQVMASFDSRANVLKREKKKFESAEQWVAGTICRLRYGDSYISNYVDYGTEFYIYSPSDLLKMYVEYRNNGVSQQVLSMIQDQYYETKHRENPGKMARVQLLTALEPNRHSTPNEVMEMYSAGLVSFESMYLKVNFSSLVGRFERENGDIINFGLRVPFAERVSAIQQSLLNYAKENKIEEGSPAV